MNDDMQISTYLEQGGKLTSPDNVGSRYRGELLRMMTAFVDSELAGAAGFADVINAGPGVKERIAASRITLEKFDHAGKLLAIMADFGVDADRYANHHPWTERVARDADIGATRQGGDMRLSVFYYPITGWSDAVVMNVLMGHAVSVQLGELARVSYQPLADAFRAIAPVERRHAELGLEGLRKLLDNGASREELQKLIDYWRPRVAASFGVAGSKRFDALRRLGLRHTANEALQQQWHDEMADVLQALGLRWR